MVQFVDPGEEDAEATGANIVSCASQCPNLEEIQITKENSRHENDIDELMNSVEDTSVVNFAEDPQIKNQTLRLFMYMTGNLIDENEGGPVSIYSLLDILHQSFEIVKAQVDKTFLPEAFLVDIERAFLFLLRESEIIGIKPIKKEELKHIKAALTSCAEGGSPRLYFAGKICKTSANIKFIAKSAAGGTRNTTAIYSPDEYSFRWGYRDIIEEATWAAMDFVHGYCYSGFSMRVNNHHLYQRAIERLFTQELISRWRQPQKLKQDLYWDNVFSTNVKVAMRNLDAAVQAAYLDSPFVHRLKRPWIEEGQEADQHGGSTELPTRRKRSAPGTPFFCLDSGADKDKLISKLKVQC
jgi:hypothetical protein